MTLRAISGFGDILIWIFVIKRDVKRPHKNDSKLSQIFNR